MTDPSRLYKFAKSYRSAMSCVVMAAVASQSDALLVIAAVASQVRVNLWDLAGPLEYLEVRNEFYKDTQAALLVFDVTNRASFEALSGWLEEARQYGATDMVRASTWFFCNYRYH